MSESDVRAARHAYEALLSGDLEPIAGLLDDGVVWHGGDPGDPAACHGRQEALAFIRGAQRRGAIGTLVDVIDAGDQVVVIMQPPSSGSEPAGPVANLTTFRDGKVTEMVHCPRAADALAAVRRR